MIDLKYWREFTEMKPSNKRTVYEGNLVAFLLEACDEIEKLNSRLIRLRLAVSGADTLPPIGAPIHGED